MNDETQYSHLRTLIGREMRDRIDDNDGNLVGRALNMAEFLMLHDPIELNASEGEIKVAQDMIESRGMGYLLNLEREEFPKYAAAIRANENPRYGSFCIKCGRSLKNETALKTGMGITCKGLITKGEWLTDRKKDNTTQRRDEIKINDALLMEDPNRLGLRKLAVKYGISVSSVRIDRQTNRMNIRIEDRVADLVDGADQLEPDTYPVIPEVIVPLPEEPKKKRGRPKGAEKPEEEPEEHGPFNPDIKCKIYNRKADGSHCRRKCKNSELVMEEMDGSEEESEISPEVDPEVIPDEPEIEEISKMAEEPEQTDDEEDVFGDE